jgi:hypothetical protein
MMYLHEHDFVSTRTQNEQKSVVCLTCGSIYCEKCGKLVKQSTIGDKYSTKGDTIQHTYTNSQHNNPLCTVVP